MPPNINILLAVVALLDAAIFWFIGGAVAAGHLKKPMPANWSPEERSLREAQNRQGGVAVRQAAPWLAALGLLMLILPMPQQQLVLVYVGGLLSIVGWILYQVFAALRTRPDPRAAHPRSGDTPDLPIR